jgi:hypothetical protein
MSRATFFQIILRGLPYFSPFLRVSHARVIVGLGCNEVLQHIKRLLIFLQGV